MAQQTVLDYQGCYGGVGIYGEEHVVTYAQTDDDVDFCPSLVKQFSLKNRVTCRFKLFRVASLVLFGNAKHSLIDATTFTDSRCYYESLCFKEVCQSCGFFFQSSTEGYTYLIYPE